MIILNQDPPNLDEIKKRMDPGPGTFYCFGDTIYNPDGIDIPQDIVHHEAVHSQQQGTNVEEWWKRYLDDPRFRFEQELEAFGEQVLFAAEKNPGQVEAIRTMISKITSILSGPQYGRILSFGEVEVKLKRYIKGRYDQQ